MGHPADQTSDDEVGWEGITVTRWSRNELTAALSGLPIDDGAFYEHFLACLPRSLDMFVALYK